MPCFGLVVGICDLLEFQASIVNCQLSIDGLKLHQLSWSSVYSSQGSFGNVFDAFPTDEFLSGNVYDALCVGSNER
jgi:hypothetical protein